MPRHWLAFLPDGHRVQSGSVAPGLRIRRASRLEIGRGATLVGPLKTAGSVYAEPQVRVLGRLVAAGRVVLGAGGIAEGHVKAGADVHLLPGAQVFGKVESGSDLHLHEGVRVVGSIRAHGDVVIHGPARTGHVSTEGRVRTLPWRPARDEAQSRPARPIPS